MCEATAAAAIDGGGDRRRRRSTTLDLRCSRDVDVSPLDGNGNDRQRRRGGEVQGIIQAFPSTPIFGVPDINDSRRRPRGCQPNDRSGSYAGEIDGSLLALHGKV